MIKSPTKKRVGTRVLGKDSVAFQTFIDKNEAGGY